MQGTYAIIGFILVAILSSASTFAQSCQSLWPGKALAGSASSVVDGVCEVNFAKAASKKCVAFLNAPCVTTEDKEILLEVRVYCDAWLPSWKYNEVIELLLKPPRGIQCIDPRFEFVRGQTWMYNAEPTIVSFQVAAEPRIVRLQGTGTVLRQFDLLKICFLSGGGHFSCIPFESPFREVK